MSEMQARVQEHLRDGLYLLAVGRVLEGRREWRRALSLSPEHPEAMDFLESTDRELTEADLQREREEVNLVNSGAVVDGRESVAAWGDDDEVTGEVSGRWRRQEAEEHSRVTPPGERPLQPDQQGWEINADASWDGSDGPAEVAVEPQRSGVPTDEQAPWEDNTQVGSNLDDWPPAPEERGGGFRGDSVEGLLGRAVSAFHDGDMKSARSHLCALLAMEPAHTAAQSYSEQIDKRLREQLQRDGVPERTVDMDEVEGMQLDLVGGYVMSLIDGQTCIDDIYALSSHLHEADVQTILLSLLEQGVIRIRQL